MEKFTNLKKINEDNEIIPFNPKDVYKKLGAIKPSNLIEEPAVAEKTDVVKFLQRFLKLVK